MVSEYGSYRRGVTKLKVYLIVHTTECGANLDWFTVAHTPEEAVALWCASEMVQEFGASKPDRVFEVPAIPDVPPCPPRLLDWFEEVKEVTP
jgi:hypothetical protein